MSFECPVMNHAPTNMQYMLSAIEHLEKVSLATFQRINEKIDEQRQILHQVHQRVAVVKHSLKNIESERSRETLLVTSSPVFPTPSIVSDKPCFSIVRDRITVPAMTKTHSTPCILKSPGVNMRLNMLHTWSTSCNHFRTMSKSLSVATGVGKYHERPISSVGELVCFNTNMNVFHNYYAVDPLNSNTTSIGQNLKQQQPTSTDFLLKIPPAPYSLSFNSIYECIQAKNHQNDIQPFVPIMSSLPALELPSDLNLPNIACTKHWEHVTEMPPLPCEISQNPMSTIQHVERMSATVEDVKEENASQTIMQQVALTEVDSSMVPSTCLSPQTHELEMPLQMNSSIERDINQQMDAIQTNSNEVTCNNANQNATDQIEQPTLMNETIFSTAASSTLWDSITNFSRDSLRRTVVNAHKDPHESSNTNPVYRNMIRVLDLRRIGIEGNVDEDDDTSSAMTDTW
ncbi:hypothetical protein C9374_008449 [Naegleria lovaniensis]|uniref:WASH1 WAHD domain-containing protein n=1 Tax=Naegleria lovaniensis TaxID=51637 RepID=A0AA88GKT8_NAELO|nr:uncharacterized protein C9374_008449 [Naegleria lovaniensis]KAG2378306.1 hypothetical protein C9374_008449 [Naegleria lovaniensis]